MPWWFVPEAGSRDGGRSPPTSPRVPRPVPVPMATRGGAGTSGAGPSRCTAGAVALATGVNRAAWAGLARRLPAPFGPAAAAARGSGASWRVSATGEETARTFAGARFPASGRAGPGPPAGPLRASGRPRLPSHRPRREGRGGEAKGGRHPRALPSAPVRPGVPAARRPLSLGGAPRSRVPLRGRLPGLWPQGDEGGGGGGLPPSRECDSAALREKFEWGSWGAFGMLSFGGFLRERGNSAGSLAVYQIGYFCHFFLLYHLLSDSYTLWGVSVCVCVLKASLSVTLNFDVLAHCALWLLYDFCMNILGDFQKCCRPVTACLRSSPEALLSIVTKWLVTLSKQANNIDSGISELASWWMGIYRCFSYRHLFFKSYFRCLNLWVLQGHLTSGKKQVYVGMQAFWRDFGLRDLNPQSVPLKLCAISDAPGLLLTAITTVIGVN